METQTLVYFFNRIILKSEKKKENKKIYLYFLLPTLQRATLLLNRKMSGKG